MSSINSFDLQMPVNPTNEYVSRSFIGHGSSYKNRSKDSVINALETGEFVWNMAT